MKLDAVNTMYNTPNVNFSGKLVQNEALETIERSYWWKTFKEGPFYKLLESDFCSGEYSFFKGRGTESVSMYGVCRNGKECEGMHNLGIGKVYYHSGSNPSYYFQDLMDALKEAIAEDFWETQNNAVKK